MFVRGKDGNALVGCEVLDRERLVDDDFVGGNLLDDVGVAISEDIVGREVGDEIRVVNKGEVLEDRGGLGLDRERLVDDDFVGGNLLDDVGVAISEDIGREVGDEIRVVNKGEVLEDRGGLRGDRYPVK